MQTQLFDQSQFHFILVNTNRPAKSHTSALKYKDHLIVRNESHIANYFPEKVPLMLRGLFVNSMKSRWEHWSHQQYLDYLSGLRQCTPFHYLHLNCSLKVSACPSMPWLWRMTWKLAQASYSVCRRSVLEVTSKRALVRLCNTQLYMRGTGHLLDCSIQVPAAVVAGYSFSSCAEAFSGFSTSDTEELILSALLFAGIILCLASMYPFQRVCKACRGGISMRCSQSFQLGGSGFAFWGFFRLGDLGPAQHWQASVPTSAASLSGSHSDQVE